MIDCVINGVFTVRMMIDSGSDVCTLGEVDWLDYKNSLGSSLENLKWGDGKRYISAYASKSALQIMASFNAQVGVGGANGPMTFVKIFAVKGAAKSLLGRDAALKLGVLKMGLGISTVNLESQKRESSREFPKVPGELVRFSIDESVPPVRQPYYNVPVAFRESARKRLREMEESGIIGKFSGAPSWISGMSAVPKGKDDFRLVVNMRAANKAILRPFHHLPTMEEMKVKLHGASWFSKLDISSAFHHLELDEASRAMTTFQTESGMMRFTRLVFGVNCAPEIFQEFMERCLAGLQGVLVYLDDILVFADTEENLNERSRAVKSALKAANLSINPLKCQFNVREPTFLGHKLSGDGFSID